MEDQGTDRRKILEWLLRT